jgi:hypothetical protein
MSIVMLALDRGHLGRVTGPFHRVLLQGELLKEGIRLNYLRDLRERWLLKATVMERHQAFRRFMGKLVEVHFADWLTAAGWTIVGMEAFNPGPDIQATRGCETRSFELKYIGQEDTDFEAIVEALNVGPRPYVLSPYDATNYLVLRAYEAAKQLQLNELPGRTAALVIDETTWHRFEMSLRNKWAKWQDAAFYQNQASPAWRAFLDLQRDKWPDIEGDLGPALRELSEIWVLRLQCEFRLHPDHHIDMPATGQGTQA